MTHGRERALDQALVQRVRSRASAPDAPACCAPATARAADRRQEAPPRARHRAQLTTGHAVAPAAGALARERSAQRLPNARDEPLPRSGEAPALQQVLRCPQTGQDSRGGRTTERASAAPARHRDRRELSQPPGKFLIDILESLADRGLLTAGGQRRHRRCPPVATRGPTTTSSDGDERLRVVAGCGNVHAWTGHLMRIAWRAMGRGSGRRDRRRRGVAELPAPQRAAIGAPSRVSRWPRTLPNSLAGVSPLTEQMTTRDGLRNSMSGWWTRQRLVRSAGGTNDDRRRCRLSRSRCHPREVHSAARQRHDSATVGDVREWFAASSHRRMAFLAEDGQYVGSLTPADLASKLDPGRRASELARRGATIAPDAPASAAHELALSSHTRRVPVVDRHGRLVGVVGVTDDLAAFCGSA